MEPPAVLPSYVSYNPGVVHAIIVRQLIGVSKNLQSESTGDVPQCPIASDATGDDANKMNHNAI